MAKILLVEDNEMNRDMLSRRLMRRGYEVILAFDGAQGIDLALSQTPDLILMDMSLPVISGWDATRKLKAAHETQAIPVIALQAGCDDYDTKPIELQRLLEKIESLLDRKRAS